MMNIEIMQSYMKKKKKSVIVQLNVNSLTKFKLNGSVIYNVQYILLSTAVASSFYSNLTFQ